MAVTYPLTMPATPNFSRASFKLDSNITLFESPLTKTEQVLERAGARWSAVYSLPAMKRGAETAAWTAFFISLRGRLGTFLAFDPHNAVARGSVPGTPKVMGASQTGNSLVTDGWGTNQSNILLPGDYIQLPTGPDSKRLHMVVEAASSDGVGSGEATLEIEPALRESPLDDDPITVVNARVVMRLLSNTVSWDEGLAEFQQFSFAAQEVL